MTKRELSSQGFQEPGSVPKRHSQLELGSDLFNQPPLDDGDDEVFDVSPEDNLQSGPLAQNYDPQDSMYGGLTTSPDDNFGFMPITSTEDHFDSQPVSNGPYLLPFTSTEDHFDSQPVSNGPYLLPFTSTEDHFDLQPVSNGPYLLPFTSTEDHFDSQPVSNGPYLPSTSTEDHFGSLPIPNGLFSTHLNDPWNPETGFSSDIDDRDSSTPGDITNFNGDDTIVDDFIIIGSSNVADSNGSSRSATDSSHSQSSRSSQGLSQTFIPEDITTFNGDDTIDDDFIIIGSSDVADSNGSSRSATDSSHSQSLRSSQGLSQSPTTHGSTGAQRTTRHQQGGQPPNPNDSESLTPGETPYSPPTLVKDTLSVPAYYPYKDYRFSYIVLAHSGLPDTIQVIVNFQQALESGGVENVENVYSWEIEHRLQKYILRTGGGHGGRTICKTSGRKDTSSIEVYGQHIVVKLCWCPGKNFKLFRPESGRQNTVNVQLECSFRNTNQVSSINCESAVSIRSKGPKGSNKTTYVPEIIQNSYTNIENFIRSIKGDDVQTARL